MSTSLSQYKTSLTAAQTAYQAALQTLYGAMIDLEALTITVERCGGGPQTHFSTYSMGEWQNLFRFLEHPMAAPRDKHFGGALVANGATTTASNALHFASVPSWVVAGLVVSDATSGTAVGTVASTSSNTVTLVANAANAVSVGDMITFTFAANGRIKEKIDAAATTYIANWSGS